MVKLLILDSLPERATPPSHGCEPMGKWENGRKPIW
jgi:hypothetical protein